MFFLAWQEQAKVEDLTALKQELAADKTDASGQRWVRLLINAATTQE